MFINLHRLPFIIFPFEAVKTSSLWSLFKWKWKISQNNNLQKQTIHFKFSGRLEFGKTTYQSEKWLSFAPRAGHWGSKQSRFLSTWKLLFYISFNSIQIKKHLLYLSNRKMVGKSLLPSRNFPQFQTSGPILGKSKNPVTSFGYVRNKPSRMSLYIFSYLEKLSTA